MLPALNGLLHRFSPASLLARYNPTYAPELYHLQDVCARGVFFVPIFHKIKQIPGDDNMKKEEDTVKTAALYIRVSTDKQEELSPDSQRRLLLDYAKSHNMIVSNQHIYTENGISGRKADKVPTDDRCRQV